MLPARCTIALAPIVALAIALPTGSGRADPVDWARERLPMLEPCSPPGVNEQFLCGLLQVPENPGLPDGRRIHLSVVVAPALMRRPRTDAWVELPGGPGNAATDYAASYSNEFRAYRRDRDVLLVDQRGMGGSGGLYCEELALHRVSPLFDRFPAKAVASCRERLVGEGVDLSQYSSAHAAYDLDAVRAWLGYPRLNLFSYSYGTRLALEYMRRYPARTRSAILWGVVAPDFRRPLYYARDGQQALDRLFDACGANIDCSQRFPDLPGDLAAAMRRLEAAPPTVSLRHPVSGETSQVSITPAGFAEGLWIALFRPDTARRIPRVLNYAAQGDFEPFLDLTTARRATQRRYYNAAHLSIVCPEEVQFVTPAAIAEAYAGTFMPEARGLQYLEACKLWGLSGKPVSLAPVISDVPTLLLSGDYDPVTPGRWADGVARTLRRSRSLHASDLSHESNGVNHAECLDNLFQDFLARPDPRRLDASCLARMRAPEFDLRP
jgi:pimeloyl-ACP methyl ester carboxylesterase